MTSVFRAVGRLAVAIWFGGGVFLAAVAAPVAFSAAGDPETAANVVGQMLARWHWISIGAPLLALVAARFRQRAPLILIVLAVILANGQWMVDNRIHEIRASIDGPVSALAPEDPVRTRFGMFHGVSMTLLLGQLLCGAGVVVSGSRARGEGSRREPGREAA